MRRTGRLGPDDDGGVAALKRVGDPLARGCGVDGRAVEDQPDGLGAPGERAADDFLALALGLGEHDTEGLVDVAEGE